MWIENVLNIRYEVWVAVGVAFLAYIISTIVRRAKSNYPPGPVGLPIVGYLPFLKENSHLQFIELAKKYGEVFSLRLGSENVVVLNGTSSIREAFSKNEFLGKPPTSAFTLLGSGISPYFTTDIHEWQEHRRFVVHSMKDLGLGRSKVEEHIQDEIDHFLDVIRKMKGKPMDLLKPLSPSMANNISALVFGKRYEYNDPEWIVLGKHMDTILKAEGQTGIQLYLPWLRYVPFISKILKSEDVVEGIKYLHDFFRKKAEERRANLDPKNSENLIDSYYIEMESRKKKDPNTSFTESAINNSVSDLYTAGSETVRTSISWSMYIMAAYPEVQRKVQKEILDVVGPERKPEYMDQKQMSYTHAVLLEVMRWKTVLPFNLLRYTLDDTAVGGYNIPKGTIVLANFWAPHHDPKNWDDPDTFKAERFLGHDGKSIQKSNNFMPFSTGKRSCLGETMANMEMFLYFVSVLQHFDVSLPKGQKPTFETEFNITYKLKQHELCFTQRS